MGEQDKTPPLMTVTEVADHLQLKEITVRDYLRTRKLKGTRFGNNWRVSIADLEEFKREGTR